MTLREFIGNDLVCLLLVFQDTSYMVCTNFGHLLSKLYHNASQQSSEIFSIKEYCVMLSFKETVCIDGIPTMWKNIRHQMSRLKSMRSEYVCFGEHLGVSFPDLDLISILIYIRFHSLYQTREPIFKNVCPEKLLTQFYQAE